MLSRRRRLWLLTRKLWIALQTRALRHSNSAMQLAKASARFADSRKRLLKTQDEKIISFACRCKLGKGNFAAKFVAKLVGSPNGSSQNRRRIISFARRYELGKGGFSAAVPPRNTKLNKIVGNDLCRSLLKELCP